MSQKFKIDDKEYETESLNEKAKAALASLQFVTSKLQELNNMQAVLQRAKNSYVESLKQEMISTKAGLLIEDN